MLVVHMLAIELLIYILTALIMYLKVQLSFISYGRHIQDFFSLKSTSHSNPYCGFYMSYGQS